MALLKKIMIRYEFFLFRFIFLIFIFYIFLLFSTKIISTDVGLFPRDTENSTYLERLTNS